MNTSRRLSAIHEARALLESDPVYLDTETTGMHLSAEVIEIGIIDDKEQVLFDSLIRPRCKDRPGSSTGTWHFPRDAGGCTHLGPGLAASRGGAVEPKDRGV